jgi:SAM-dependent methyltransferase
MKQIWSEKVKQFVRRPIYKAVYRGKEAFECPICGYHGPFRDKVLNKKPSVIRKHAKCLGCGAFERQRMLYLLVNEILNDWNASQKKMLHIAPELYVRSRLSELFGVYHTTDLFEPDVDFKEDVQAMSFADGSYDCVLISRVLTIPPDFEASIREIRRVLKNGGLAIIAETYTLDKTNEFGEMRNGRSRVIGIDALELYGKYFDRVERVTSDRYPEIYQLRNVMTIDGEMMDNYPDEVRVPGVGFNDLVAVCHV